MAADGVSTSEIARRLGIIWRTAARLVAASDPPSYSRASAGSMLDPLEPVLRQLIEDWPEIKAPRVTEMLRDDPRNPAWLSGAFSDPARRVRPTDSAVNPTGEPPHRSKSAFGGLASLGVIRARTAPRNRGGRPLAE